MQTGDRMDDRSSSAGEMAGGRVTLRPGQHAVEYPLFSEDGPPSASTTLESLRSINVHESAVARLCFSQLNIDALQNALRYRVNRASLEAGVPQPGYIIGRQNDRELSIVLRGVYQQFGRNMPTQVTEQVRDLNAKVLEFAVPRILQQVHSYHQYRTDISTPYSLMQRGQIAGTKGDKQLGQRPV